MVAASKPDRHLALADLCLRDVIQRDPDHAESRRLLGYVRYKQGWATPHALDLLDRGYVVHPKVGWVPADWVPHLDAGELPGEFTASGKPRNWIAAAEANRRRQAWTDRWTIDTAPHFRVESNVELAEAVEFAARLEAFYQLFLSQFADVIGAENLPLARRFDHKGQRPVATPGRFAVEYFASQTEYITNLRDRFGLNEDVSLGFYLPRKVAARANTGPRSFFYKDEANPIAAHATLYHEASHQILFETAGRTAYDRNRTNYWIWEGLGTYFETTEPQEDGSILVGGLVGPRIEQARIRILERGEYVPLETFTAMGESKFREDADEAVYRNYAQAMALTVFLLHGEGEKYRERFLALVADAYRGKVKANSLEERLGVSFVKLDAEFRAFLEAGPEGDGARP